MSAVLPKLTTEAHVQQSVREFLELDGWRPIRTHPLPPIVQRLDAIMAKAPPGFRGAWRCIRGYVLKHADAESFGELGMPDYLFIRYYDTVVRAEVIAREPGAVVAAEVLWIEFKRKRGLPKAHQVRWHDAEIARGALVMVVDDIDEFTCWYKSSGLNRRIK